MSRLTTADIEAVIDLADELCGIYLDDSKDYLIESRLARLVQNHECKSYVELVQKVRSGGAQTLKKEVIDALTTNETLWFRDSSPFEALKYKIVPELIDARSNSLYPKKFRVWSAASSTGQEVYSIAMAFAYIIQDYHLWDIEIMGNDISPSAIAKAKSGRYSKLEMSRGMDLGALGKYFDEEEDSWVVKPKIRNMCKFSERNIHEPFIGVGDFDLIFCRNVAIYFTEQDRKRLFHKLSEKLVPDGWIFVGSSESLRDLGPEWVPQRHCGSLCYRPNQARLPYETH